MFASSRGQGDQGYLSTTSPRLSAHMNVPWFTKNGRNITSTHSAGVAWVPQTPSTPSVDTLKNVSPRSWSCIHFGKCYVGARPRSKRQSVRLPEEEEQGWLCSPTSSSTTVYKCSRYPTVAHMRHEIIRHERTLKHAHTPSSLTGSKKQLCELNGRQKAGCKRQGSCLVCTWTGPRARQKRAPTFDRSMNLIGQTYPA